MASDASKQAGDVLASTSWFDGEPTRSSVPDARDATDTRDAADADVAEGTEPFELARSSAL